MPKKIRSAECPPICTWKPIAGGRAPHLDAGWQVDEANSVKFLKYGSTQAPDFQ
jgi:hypothetical protein